MQLHTMSFCVMAQGLPWCMSLKTTLGTGTFSSQSVKLYDTHFQDCPAATNMGTVSQLQPASFSLVLQLDTADKCPAMLGHRLQGGLCCPLNEGCDLLIVLL
ncbi:TPA: hypothetical protein ACH3X3_001236 [Trebouxia sp. C0006]